MALATSLFIAGCFKQPEQTADAGAVKPVAESTAVSTAKAEPATKRSVGAVLKDIGAAPAAAIISDYTKPFFGTGLILIVLGAVMFAFFGGKGSAVGMVAIGVFTTWTGTSIIQYPWVTLLVPVAIAVILVLVVRHCWQIRKAAAVVVESVENAEHKGEVTAAIKEHGQEAVQLVRWLVDPIKALLAKEEKATEKA